MDFSNWNQVQRKIYESPEVNNVPDDGVKNVLFVQPDWDALRVETEFERAKRFEEEKIKLREAERERKKAVIDVLGISDDGTIYSETKNTWNEFQKRSITNFSSPNLKIFKNLETGERVFIVSITIGTITKSFLMEESECGDAKILLKKLNADGADFLSRRQTEKKIFAIQLWSTLLRKNPEEITICNEIGWYKNSDGNIKFALEEDMTWHAIRNLK